MVDNGSTDGSAGSLVPAAPASSSCLTRGFRSFGIRARALLERRFWRSWMPSRELAPGWSSAAMVPFHDPAVGAVGAQYHAPPDGTWVRRMYDRFRRRHSGQRSTDWLPSGNIAVRRTALNQSAGLTNHSSLCEDVDFCHRLRVKGWKPDRNRRATQRASRRPVDAERLVPRRALAGPGQSACQPSTGHSHSRRPEHRHAPDHGDGHCRVDRRRARCSNHRVVAGGACDVWS